MMILVDSVISLSLAKFKTVVKISNIQSPDAPQSPTTFVCRFTHLPIRMMARGTQKVAASAFGAIGQSAYPILPCGCLCCPVRGEVVVGW